MEILVAGLVAAGVALAVAVAVVMLTFSVPARSRQGAGRR